MICTSHYVSDVSHHISMLENPLLSHNIVDTNAKTNKYSKFTNWLRISYKYGSNPLCLTESPHIHITSHNYILITLNNNKLRQQILQLFDRRGVCASECKQCISHAENAHVATTKLHTSMSNAATTYKLYALIGLHSYWTSRKKFW